MLKMGIIKAVMGITLMGLNVAYGQTNEFEQVSRQAMEILCKGKYTYSKEHKQYVCPICPSFTSSGADNRHEEFSITKVIPGKFLPNSDKVVYYIEYFGCEPHAYNFGGHMVMVDGKLYTHPASEAYPLGDCKVVKGENRDLLRCVYGFMAQGKVFSSKLECGLDPKKMYFVCKKLKQYKAR